MKSPRAIMNDLSRIDFDTADQFQGKLIGVALMALLNGERDLAMLLDGELNFDRRPGIEQGLLKQEVNDLVKMLNARGDLGRV